MISVRTNPNNQHPTPELDKMRSQPNMKETIGKMKNDGSILLQSRGSQDTAAMALSKFSANKTSNAGEQELQVKDTISMHEND